MVATTSPATWWVAVAVLTTLNLASEAVSFSDVMQPDPALRWLDRLGPHRANVFPSTRPVLVGRRGPSRFSSAPSIHGGRERMTMTL